MPGALRAPAAAIPETRALTTPLGDLLTGGAASLAVLAALALTPGGGKLVEGNVTLLSFLVNWPHFAASYHLLYSTPGAARKHPVAAVVAPALMALYVAVALAAYARAPLIAALFHAAAAAALGWHYTGQAWGALAASAFLERLRVDEAERRLIKANLTVLLLWHAFWAAHLIGRALGPELFNRLYHLATAAAGASALLGVAGLTRFYKRNGRLPARVLLPWLALHGWYLAIALNTGTTGFIVFAQLAHAAQYLPFAARVRANRAARKPSSAGALAYAAGLALAGAAAFKLLPDAADRLLPGVASVLLIDALALQHYVVDACVWKLGDPEVRADLFAHLR